MGVCGRAHDPTRERGRIGKRAAALARQYWGFGFGCWRNLRRSHAGQEGTGLSKDPDLIGRSEGFWWRKAAGASCIAVTSAARPPLNTHSWHLAGVDWISALGL
jgi:hypothetical protein